MAKKVKRSLDEILSSIDTDINVLVNEFKEKNVKTKESVEEFETKWQAIVAKHIGVSPNKLIKKLSSHLKTKAEEFANSIEYIAENNSFELSKFHTEPNKKAEAILKLGSDVSNWRVMNVSKDDEYNCLLVSFGCTAVNSGKDLVGYVYLNNEGVVKHHFTHIYTF